MPRLNNWQNVENAAVLNRLIERNEKVGITRKILYLHKVEEYSVLNLFTII